MNPYNTVIQIFLGFIVFFTIKAITVTIFQVCTIRDLNGISNIIPNSIINFISLDTACGGDSPVTRKVPVVGAEEILVLDVTGLLAEKT